MAKTKAPLLSMGASGKLGGVLVYGSWKGLDVAREYVIPANPNTAAQSTQRGHLTAAVADWHTVGPDELEGADKEAWNRYAGTLAPMSGFNAFCKEWIDEEVAGGTPPGHFFDMNITDPVAASWDMNIEGSGLATETVTLRMGASLTFFPVTETDVATAGVAAFVDIDTGFATGTRVYFYVEVGTPGTDYMRSGIYTAILS